MQRADEEQEEDERIREAAFAGSFYPAKRGELERQLDALLASARGVAKDAAAVVSPHAGYKYSGEIAAWALSALNEYETYVLISPNHTGLGELVSVYPGGCWETPLGRVKVNGKLCQKICNELGVEADEIAHIQEHSIEVQLPLMQRLMHSFEIVPITIGVNDAEFLRELGDAIFKVCGRNVGVVASSDFSHYVPQEDAEKRDLGAIGLIEALDLGGFHRLASRQGMSICGMACITAAMEYCRKLGIGSGKLLKYGTSATATGDKQRVVGYAAIKFPETQKKAKI